jgi:broad specificity phosphatase PhoE
MRFTMWLSLVRSGRTALVEHGRLQGRSAGRLTQLGRADASGAAAALSGFAVGAVLASPARRARETADLIVRALDSHARSRTVSGLAPVDLGTWEGRTLSEIRARDPAAADTYVRLPTAVDFPEGERMLDAERRAFEALRSEVDPADPRMVVAVTHELIIRMILLRLRRLDGSALWDPHVAPGSIHPLRVTDSGFEIPSTLEDLLRVAERGQGQDPPARVRADPRP